MGGHCRNRWVIQARTVIWVCFSGCIFALTGCDRGLAPVQQTPLKEAKPVVAFGKPQPRLETVKLYLGPAELVAEVADNNEKRRRGMMFRDSLPENEGMLFVFDGGQARGFWMENTTVPLSIGYIGTDSRLLEIHPLNPGDTNVVLSKSKRIQFALEVNRGWYEKNGVKPGVFIASEAGPLAKAFR